MNNYYKHEKYAELMEKLKKSLKNEFYYESIFIEYAIIEDRTESLLRHANIKTTDSKNYSLKLNDKLRKIKNNKIFEDKYIKKHLEEELISSIYEWKNDRNKLIHDLIGCPYTNDKIKEIALNGEKIIKTLNNKSTLINKYLDRIK